MSREESVRLQSSDGETFDVSMRVAKLSRTLETMLRGQQNYLNLTSNIKFQNSALATIHAAS